MASPAVRVLERFDEIRGAGLAHIVDPNRRRTSRLQPVDPSVGCIHLALMVAEVIHLLVVPVADVNRAIGPDLNIHRPEPPVVASDRMPEIMGFEGGFFGQEFAQNDASLQRFYAEEPTVISRRQSTVVIDEKIVGEPRDAVVGHCREVPEGIGVGERPVFLEALLQIGSLLVVEAPRVSTIVAGEDSPAVVDLAAEGIASAF